MDFKGVSDGVTMTTEAIKGFFLKSLFNVEVAIHMEWK